MTTIITTCVEKYVKERASQAIWIREVKTQERQNCSGNKVTTLSAK